PMLTQPEFADFYQMFGRAALTARGEDHPKLERLHWFTVEFGLIAEGNERRIFGAGILSSKEEVTHALSDQVTVHPFDPAVVVEQTYDVWHLQDELFMLDSFEQLVAGFSAWAGRRGLLAEYGA
ncbi:MAG TPA: phenylalanine 4-monooxygenase, partial [Rhodothermales bacterium]